MQGYKWLTEDGRSLNGDEGPWQIGQWREVKGELAMCENGYHCSPTPYDAFMYTSSPTLALVEFPDDPFSYLADDTKQCARRMRVLKMADAIRQLQQWALDCYDHSLLVSPEITPDPRSLVAIQTARRYLANQCDLTELQTALPGAEAAWRRAYAALWSASAAWWSASADERTAYAARQSGYAAWWNASADERSADDAAQSADASLHSVLASWRSADDAEQNADDAYFAEVAWQENRFSELVLPLLTHDNV